MCGEDPGQAVHCFILDGGDAVDHAEDLEVDQEEFAFDQSGFAGVGGVDAVELAFGAPAGEDLDGGGGAVDFKFGWEVLGLNIGGGNEVWCDTLTIFIDCGWLVDDLGK